MPDSVRHWIHRIPRAGREDGDYEDAATVSGDEWPLMVAVADGATESAFARIWAEILVNRLVAAESLSEATIDRLLPEARSAWRRAVAGRVQGRPWYVTAKATEGAFATLLGLSIEEDGGWRALSVGDCCLFHVRDGSVKQSWPFTSSAAFGDRPALLASRSNRQASSSSTVSGTWEHGDLFLLATDALAAWMLDRGMDSLAPMDGDEFRAAVRAGRESGHLRNDDITLAGIHLE